MKFLIPQRFASEGISTIGIVHPNEELPLAPRKVASRQVLIGSEPAPRRIKHWSSHSRWQRGMLMTGGGSTHLGNGVAHATAGGAKAAEPPFPNRAERLAIAAFQRIYRASGTPFFAAPSAK